MTCIIGLVSKDKVIIGADSAGTSDNDIFIRKDPKIFYNGEFLIGCTTSFRMIQLLRYSFNPPEITKDIYEYMCTDFIDEVRKCFKKGGFLQSFENGSERGGTFLVGWKSRLFRVSNDFQVAENLSGIDSIGSGCEYALGSLQTSLYLMEDKDQNRIRIALETASIFNNSVAAPYVILETK